MTNEKKEEYIRKLEDELNPKYIKNELLKLLHNIGIPETDIQVKLYSLEKNNKKPMSNVLGWYKSNSQFRSVPIMYYNLANIVNTLDEYGLTNINNYEELRISAKETVLDTICHEYGHVIEEFLHFNHKRNIIDNDKLKEDTEIEYIKFYENFSRFNDYPANENFAEDFGVSLSRGYPLNEIEGLEDVINYFKNYLFDEQSLNWVVQPKYIKDVEEIFLKDKKMNDFYSDEIGFLGMSKDVCERMVELNKKMPSTLFEIVKCSNPKKIELLGCDEVRFPLYSHYILKVTDKETMEFKFMDFMSEHTFGKIYLSENQLDDLWEKKEILQSESKNTVKKKNKI